MTDEYDEGTMGTERLRPWMVLLEHFGVEERSQVRHARAQCKECGGWFAIYDEHNPPDACPMCGYDGSTPTDDGRKEGTMGIQYYPVNDEGRFVWLPVVKGCDPPVVHDVAVESNTIASIYPVMPDDTDLTELLARVGVLPNRASLVTLSGTRESFLVAASPGDVVGVANRKTCLDETRFTCHTDEANDIQRLGFAALVEAVRSVVTP